MRNYLLKRLITLLSVAFIIFLFQFNIYASENELQIAITPEEDCYTLSVFIPAPDKLTDIDLTFFNNSNGISFAAISTENTDTAKYSSSLDNFPEIIDEEKTYFTYYSEISNEKLEFSGYFLDSFSSEEKFYLCDIKLIVSDELSSDDTVSIVYRLTNNENTVIGTDTYFIQSGKNIVNTEKVQYPLGDADLNGKVTANDARLILRASVGLHKLDFMAIPYVNSDYNDSITASDARYALRASVSLEEQVIHSFEITLNEGSACESGGEYTFRCTVTHKSFSMKINEGQHLQADTSCFDTGKCIICHKTVFPASSHAFTENGVCTTCGADSEIINEAESKLIPILENISSFDSFAHQALENNNKLDFIKFTELATAEIKKAAEITKGINGLQTICLHLEKAYSIRFEAFIRCTDETGKIKVNTVNCKLIENAVKNSNAHIDYASYLNIE